jgi:hypothetical protein
MPWHTFKVVTLLYAEERPCIELVNESKMMMPTFLVFMRVFQRNYGRIESCLHIRSAWES